MARPAVVSGTTVRFASLVAAILGTGTYALGLVYTAVPANTRAAVLTYARCGEIRDRLTPSPDLDPLAYRDALDRARLAVGQCVEPYERTEAWWLLAGLGL